jgi:hypothetical protein
MEQGKEEKIHWHQVRNVDDGVGLPKMTACPRGNYPA